MVLPSFVSLRRWFHPCLLLAFTMANPSDAATKLLFGTGVGLLLVAGFGFIEGRATIDEPSLGWLFILIGFKNCQNKNDWLCYQPYFQPLKAVPSSKAYPSFASGRRQ